jgi:hypothetical protein
MRSNSIIKTLDTGQNRFELCHQVFKAIRMLHFPGSRVQDTVTDALQRLAGAGRQEVSIVPENASEAALEVRQEQAAIESQGRAHQPESLTA